MIMGGSAYLGSGSEEMPNSKKNFANTLTSGKIVLGICLGAQLLAETCGGRPFTN
jgi:GMP synthase-like glutamine amidotransferase